MHRPIRLMSLAALTCAGILAAAPAYAGCGGDAPKATTPATATAAVGLGAKADANVGLGLGLNVALDVNVDLGLGLGLDAQGGTRSGTLACGKPAVLRYCG
ncbi:hypothetical protein OHB01_10535 [Microbispora hainanensis]|uniref:DUF320 domain-containing protein n=2 Tax=Streptosporangiaceae TaxID=2004 RepID=A0ABZ1SLA0_9ACTN|nr:MULTISPECIES: hypothetical protein [Microbispora]NJP27577.1 hypothetical protein [Microbispora sp. CL1-1]TQS10830.1 hypothetical protein FLW53_25875 [Microbispora sp. SCL1-1]